MGAPRDVPAPRRALGSGHAALVTVGAMIGGGIFANPGEVARKTPSPAVALAVWTAGGVVSLLGALSIAELGAAIPATGGLYVYLRRAYGPLVAFLFGWAMLVVLVPSSVGYFAQITAAHLAPPLGVDARAVALAVVALVAAVNVAGVRTAARVQSVTAVAKYAGLAAAGLAALAFTGHAAPETPPPSSRAASWSSALAALVPVLWAYDGWIDVTSIAGEVRDAPRRIPRALVSGTLAVTAVYLVVVTGYVHALGFHALGAAAAPGNALGLRLGGARGEALLAALVALSSFGGCVIGMLTGTRVVQAMGAGGDFLRALGPLGPAGTPDRVIAVTAVLAAGYVLVPVLGALGDVFVIGTWPFYALGAAAVVVLRQREATLPRPFRVPCYPWPVAGFLAASVGLLGSYAWREPRSTLASFGLVAAGLPIYLAYRARVERVSSPRE